MSRFELDELELGTRVAEGLVDPNQWWWALIEGDLE